MKYAELLNPSLIITDINLNGQLDGVEAIARLQSSYNIPYIFITACDDYSSLIYSYNLSPVSIIKDLLTKTISMKVLKKLSRIPKWFRYPPRKKMKNF